jgi:hypothetical protein
MKPVGQVWLRRIVCGNNVRVTDRGVESRNYLIKRFGGAQGESLYFDFPYHLTSLSVENSSPNMGGPLFDCPMISFHQGSLSKKR